MHPQNIFGEAILLFVVGIILIIRDRGSASVSNTYDSLLGWLLIVLSFIRMSELFSSFADSHIHARTIVWLMTLIPVVIFSWLTYYHSDRFDVLLLLVLSIAYLIAITLSLMISDAGYDVVSPNSCVGASNGIYRWIRTDGSLTFLPFSYYMILTLALIYLTAFSVASRDYWVLVTLTTIAYITAFIISSEVRRNPQETLGSVTCLTMLAVGVVAIFLVPG